MYVHRRASDDAPSAVLELRDDEARQLGALLGGAYERPRIVEELEMALGELSIEWVPVPHETSWIGMTLADCAFRARAGVTVIAILRDPEPISGAQPEDVIRRATRWWSWQDQPGARFPAARRRARRRRRVLHGSANKASAGVR
jgi:K+/H+ antiporter YhaU regulatory subunit KhtT